MKKALALVAVALTLGMTLATTDADAAKRLGGGKSVGMQRQQTAPATPPATTRNAPDAPNQAAPAAGATAAAAPGAAAAAAAPKRSWMGPVAGLAAGLGLAALASHFGFGEALANAMMLGLIVMAVLLLVGFVLRKRAASQGPALAGAAGAMQRQQQSSPFGSDGPVAQPQGGSLIGSRIGAGLGVPAAQPAGIPADFDTVGFERNAKGQFLALQAANDARDLDRLREFLTPAMFDLVRADIAERGDAPQATEVFGLEAQVLDVAQEDDRYVVSVRFTGSVRDQRVAIPEDLDEVWHLTKPRAGAGGWVIAGIQQRTDGTQPH
jgi:predicted lipid-binding transport protein (Tim44 family)